MAKPGVRIVSIGFETGRIKGWEDFVPEVRAPRNYKDAAKIAAYEAEAKAKQAEESAENPMTAGIIKLVAVTVNADGERVLTKHDSLVDLLSTHSRDERGNELFVAPRGNLLFEAALLEAASAKNPEASVSVLTGLFVAPMFPRIASMPPYIDPLRVLRTGNDLNSVLPLLRRLGVECKEYSLNTAEWWATIGYILAERLALAKTAEILTEEATPNACGCSRKS